MRGRWLASAGENLELQNATHVRHVGFPNE